MIAEEALLGKITTLGLVASLSIRGGHPTGQAPLAD
jgi:hypothetical protein